MVERLDLKPGTRFGRLVLIGERENRNGKVYEKCKCDCGNIKWIHSGNLKTGNTRSCGCLQKERARANGMIMRKHGMRYTRFYKIYYQIYNRCTNKNGKDYCRYGGRGINCLWKNFEEFKDSMYESYLDHVKKFGEKETTIDRIDVNGNYCKENCRWITWKEQANNRRTNHKIKYKGKIYPSISVLCNELGLDYSRTRKRIQQGWDVVKAIETPLFINKSRCVKITT